MLFSIIVPVYNVEKYLDECVESIVNQEYRDFELILVDDGSTDHSSVICDKWAEKDERIQVIHKKNGGLSDTRNVGTQKASGEYVVYIDSDDYISDTQFLVKLAEKARSNCPDIILYKFQKYYDEQKRLEACKFGFPTLHQYAEISDKVAYLVQTDSFYCSAWSKAIKRKILVDNSIEFEKGLLGEDQEWYYHVLSVIKSIDGIDEAFIAYRQRPNSITSSWKIKNLTDCIDIVKKWAVDIEQSDRHELKYKEALLNSIAKLYCNLLIAYCRFEDRQKKQYYSQLKQLAYLLKYDVNPRVHKMGAMHKLVGFRGLMCALSLVCKIR